MMRNTIARAAVRLAVKKGLADIDDNPGRGLRNLVDLGELMSVSQYQKELFRDMREKLSNTSSPYYDLVKRLAVSVDHDTIMTFGENLGYQCWSYGAKVIRETERKNGFNVPWSMQINLSGRDEAFTDDVLDNVVAQGTEQGIFCYMLGAEADAGAVKAAVDLSRRYALCAFAVFVKPGMLTEDTTELLAQCHNLAIVVDVQAPAQELATARQRLDAHRCLYGGYARVDSQTEMERLYEDSKDLLFLSCVGAQESITAEPTWIDETRAHPRHPVFLIDLWNDILMIDEIISSEGCLFCVDAQGEMRIINRDRRAGFSTEGKVYTRFLRDILRDVCPKAEHVTATIS